MSQTCRGHPRALYPHARCGSVSAIKIILGSGAIADGSSEAGTIRRKQDEFGSPQNEKAPAIAGALLIATRFSR
jgi:hypothetical protein